MGYCPLALQAGALQAGYENAAQEPPLLRVFFTETWKLLFATACEASQIMTPPNDGNEDRRVWMIGARVLGGT